MLAQKAYGFLEDGFKSKKPFFLTVAPVAPHSNVNLSSFDPGKNINDSLKAIVMTAPIPAERHKHLFPNAKVPRGENFNPDKVNQSAARS